MGRPDLEPVVLNEASNEIVNQYLDCSKAQKALGWKPQYSRAEGLELTIDWYEKYLRSDRPAVLGAEAMSV
jgi:nucleoside-diphosphate-sugar epimerase